MKSDRDFKQIEKMLGEGMVKGQMHTTLRDSGRLAGGMLSAGRLSRVDIDALERIACDLSINSTTAQATWQEAVEYGRAQPVEARRQRTPTQGGGFGWDDPIYIGPATRQPDVEVMEPLVDENYVESEDIPDPEEGWEGNDIIRYLEAVFQPDEYVGIVADCWEREPGKYLPKKGVCDRTAASLIDLLRKGSDYCSVIGDYPRMAGVWVRINPLDGKGVKDENVTDFRHTLIEADDQDLGKQLGLIRALQLPCAAIVHSGCKSIHAIVKIQADTLEQYRKRVDQLYSICRKNGLKVDQANRNPSRLSRLPGVYRGEKCQYLISGATGLPSWDDWIRWTEETNDNLPEITNMEDVFNLEPNMAPELIAGILRVGHKMRITGPSKAGKSFALIALGCAIAEGKDWMGLKCTQGKVLYINGEISAESFYERVRLVYRALGWKPDTISSLRAWNLRGKTVPLEALLPGLIRRCKTQGFRAVIIDPIYKFNWGDENDAGASSKFCNMLERVCTELGVSIIDCHHHSKGSQGQKRAMDRGSGSGVFSRDPDAILDMIELNISDERRAEVANAMVQDALEALGRAAGVDLDNWPEDARRPAEAAILSFQQAFPGLAQKAANVVFEASSRADRMTGWRVEATLREFAPLAPLHVWFDHPVHRTTGAELLQDAKADGEEAPWEAKARAARSAKEAKREAAEIALEKAIEGCGGPGRATIKGVMDLLGSSEKTVRKMVKEGNWNIHKGLILEKTEDEE
jgi:RecA-family ATPase